MDNTYKGDPAEIQAITQSIEAIFRHKFPEDKTVLGVGDVFVMQNVSSKQEPHRSVEILKVLLHQNPSIMQSIIDPIKGIFRDAFPDCGAIMDSAITAIEDELKMLNWPPGPKLHSEAQVSKALLQTLLNAIIERDPDIMQTVVGFIRTILEERLSYYPEAIDPAVCSKVIDIAINNILGIPQQPPEVQASKDLFYAIVSGDLAKVEAIMKSRYGLTALNTPHFSNGDTPLHYAVRRRAVEIIRLLSTEYGMIFRNAITQKNKQGKTPADLAETSSNPEIREILSRFKPSIPGSNRRLLELDADPSEAELRLFVREFRSNHS
ncbi:MAG: ankyrin repeat domain-containing protein [Puniceicoccales bacterium]|nr:ankyrin repeat domain-containing protein [Puniceicoccales bacterium]